MTIPEKFRSKHNANTKPLRVLLRENEFAKREYKQMVQEKLKPLIHKKGTIEPAYEIYNKNTMERKNNRKKSFGVSSTSSQPQLQQEEEEEEQVKEEYEELDLHEEEEIIAPPSKKQKKLDSILMATKELIPKRIDFKLSSSKTVNKNNNNSMDVFDIFKGEAVDITPLNQEETIFEIQYLSKTTPKKQPPPSQQTTPQKQQPTPQKQQHSSVHIDEDRTLLDPPPFFLYETSTVLRNLHWKQKHMVGNGLNNLGNTCFMNAALQCLAYTPPVVYFLMEQSTTSSSSNGKQFNALEALSKTISKMQSPLFSYINHHSVSPQEMAKNLKSIGRFRLGRQEDSHEFFIQLLDKLEQSILKSYQNKNLDKRILRTNFVNQTFGGILRSQIRSSNYISNTYDPFIDIGINCCKTIEEGLKQFITPEILDGKNKYKEPITKTYVKAMKQMTIHQLPPVLVIHLKRFDYLGRKIKKHVQFESQLNMSPYLSDSKEDKLYDLYAILVHDGGSCNSGHYYSFVKSSNESWYCMDDSLVSQVSSKRVLEQNPYMLFYLQRSSTLPLPLQPPPMNGKVKSPTTTATIASTSSPATTSTSTVSVKVPTSNQEIKVKSPTSSKKFGQVIETELKPIKDMSKHIDTQVLNQFEDHAMESWELEESKEAKEKQKRILKRETMQQIQGKKKDEWDQLLDMGKSKKRKLAMDAFDMLPRENVFQKLSNKKQRRI